MHAHGRVLASRQAQQISAVHTFTLPYASLHPLALPYRRSRAARCIPLHPLTLPDNPLQAQQVFLITPSQPVQQGDVLEGVVTVGWPYTPLHPLHPLTSPYIPDCKGM